MGSLKSADIVMVKVGPGGLAMYISDRGMDCMVQQ